MGSHALDVDTNTWKGLEATTSSMSTRLSRSRPTLMAIASTSSKLVRTEADAPTLLLLLATRPK